MMRSMESIEPAGTRASLMQTAEVLLCSKGYAAFSYADLAQAVGIRKASIHHHFPGKEDLGVAVVQAYVERVAQALNDIERAHVPVAARLEAFARWFMEGVPQGRLPLCGALAAEKAALPESLQAITRQFFLLQLRWLKRILDLGVARKELAQKTDTRACARQILSQLEGACFVGWAVDERKRFDTRVLWRIVGMIEHTSHSR